MSPLKILVFLICCLTVSSIAMSQTDTIFYNSEWNETKSRDSIAYYRILSKKDGIYTAKDYYLTGQVQMEGTYSSLDPDIKHGYFKYYDSLGFIQDEGNHINNKRDGKWIEYIPRKNKVGIVSNWKNDSLNGTRTVYYLEGNIQWLDTFVNGKAEGNSITYYRYSGIVEKEIEHRDNKANGVAIFNDSAGTIKSTGKFVDGKKQGVWTRYYTGEKIIKSTMTYDCDTPSGPFVGYYRSGNKMLEGYSIGKYRQGEMTAYYDAKDKIKRKEIFRNDKKEGRITYYDSASGKIRTEGFFANDLREGEWKFYFGGTDKIKSIEYYRGDEVHGEVNIYFWSGVKKGEGVFDNGRKVGKHITYFESGTLKFVENADGHGNSRYTYYDSLTGKVKVTGKIADKLKDGEWLYYYPGTDVVKAKENIKRGISDGEYFTYYAGGSKRIVGQYKDDKRDGKWKYYYPSGKDWIIRSYKKGNNDGELISYHETGAVRRREKWLDGNLISAQCFSEFGEEVAYTKLYQAPEFEGDISTFVGRELQYPESAERASIEGKVIVEFAVNEDGSLSDFTIKKSLSQDCDEEAIRVVSKMESWKPAQLDGQSLKETVTVPVVFWLRDSEGE